MPLMLRDGPTALLKQAKIANSEINVSAYVCILEYADGSYYVGSTRGSLEQRVQEHNSGIYGGYTSPRRPVRLAWHQHFVRITDAVAAEQQLKGWSRAKKEALMRGDWAASQKPRGAAAKRSNGLIGSLFCFRSPCFETPPSAAPQHEAIE